MINIAEILRRCPIGTKLFCSILGPCNLYNVSETNGSITVRVDDGATYVFTQEGKLPLSNAEITLAECILFPSRENRDWNKFEQSLLSQYSTETLRNELGKNIFSNMYIYEIIAIKLDCDGHEIGQQILKRYLHKEDAIRFKTDWEALWKKHTSNNECISPCWYDYRKDISINVVQVETKY